MAKVDGGTATVDNGTGEVAGEYFEDASIAFGGEDDSIDFGGVRDGFEPMPNGAYDSELTAFSMGIAKSGNKKIKLEYTITEDGEFSGRKAWADLSLSSNALWKVKKAAVALGADKDIFGGRVNIQELFASLVGNACILVLGSHEFLKEGDSEPRRFQDVIDFKPAVY